MNYIEQKLQEFERYVESLGGDINIGETEVYLMKVIHETLLMAKEKTFSDVNRVEIIDWTDDKGFGGGRVFVCWQEDVEVKPEFQDDNRTLKVFLKTRK